MKDVLIDLKNRKFGRLTVIKRAENSKQGLARWVCRCECGKETIVRSYDLRKNRVVSCGCYKNENFIKRNTRHNMSRSRIYYIWNAMRQRTENKTNKEYKYYGGRGISVCKEWISFENFYNWALINGYKENLTIERLDVNGNYCPQNCTFISKEKQTKNRRFNVFFLLNGKKVCASDLFRIINFPKGTYYSRKCKAKKTEICDLFKGVDFNKYKIERF